MRTALIAALGLLAGAPHAWAEGPLAALELAVGTGPATDGVDVVVALGSTRAPCFVATPETRVALNGQALKLDQPGGAAAPSKISGVQMQMTACATATFRGVVPAGAAERDVITVELGAAKARAEVVGLLAPRSLALKTPATARAGDTVQLAWQPATDVWSGRPDDALVWLYHPSDSLSLEVKAADLQREGGVITFKLPTVRPGPARVEFRGTYLEARPPVPVCEGLKACTASGSTNAGFVEITVQP